jgi:hypothetical protein
LGRWWGERTGRLEILEGIGEVDGKGEGDDGCEVVGVALGWGSVSGNVRKRRLQRLQLYWRRRQLRQGERQRERHGGRM